MFKLIQDELITFKMCMSKRLYMAELNVKSNESSWENRLFAYAKTKTQISFAGTAKLISAFLFAT